MQEPSHDLDAEHYVKLCREAIALIDMSVAAAMWGTFHYRLGILIAHFSPNPSAEEVEESIAVHRQALTVITIDAAQNLWAKTMRYLADSFLKR